MNKFFKIITLSFVFTFLIFSLNCFAENIEMDLTSNEESNNIISQNNTVYDNVENTSFNENIENSSKANDEENEISYDSTSSHSGIVDTLHSLPESELGLTNILNIILIAIGIVLILLSIAIFIKIKQ